MNLPGGGGNGNGSARPGGGGGVGGGGVGVGGQQHPYHTQAAPGAFNPGPPPVPVPPFMSPAAVPSGGVLYPPEYGPGYYGGQAGPEGWRGPGQSHHHPHHQHHPVPALQKKPKELDKAMWVGNVLNDTTIAELQAIFEAEPTEEESDIQHDVPESIFILAKSNCAFVNYSSHEAVDRAVARFHDREFKNTRLVCRPRKDPAAESSSLLSKSLSGPGRFQQQHHPIHLQPQYPSGQSSPYMSTDSTGYFKNDQSSSSDDARRYELADTQTSLEKMHLSGGGTGSSVPNSPSSGGGEGVLLLNNKDRKSTKKSRSSSSLGFSENRYFILKSLNEEDLKLSVQYGRWATQEHLVPILNDAFENTGNVYLVFSANKSGEFFGYARMTTPINPENSYELEATEAWKPSIEIPLSPEMRAAMLEQYENAKAEGKELTNEEAEEIARGSTTTKSWGTVFCVEWIHVHKVPFSRTTHLLNPLYENREVKASKDGTEVEASVGEQLLSLFLRTNSGRGRRGSGRDSASATGSRSNSEAGGSRRSSVAGSVSGGDHGHPMTTAPSSLAPPSLPSHQSGRSPSSRRSSIMSTRSVGSNATAGDHRRTTSVDPSSSSSSSQSKHSYTGQHNVKAGGNPQSQFNQRGGNQYDHQQQHHQQYRSSGPNNRQGQYGYPGYDPSSPSPYNTQGPPPSNQYNDRSGWKSSNYRGGYGGNNINSGSPNLGAGDYGTSPRGPVHMMQGHNNYQEQRKGGKYNNNSGQNAYYSGPGYDGAQQQPYYPLTHGPRRPPPGGGPSPPAAGTGVPPNMTPQQLQGGGPPVGYPGGATSPYLSPGNHAPPPPPPPGYPMMAPSLGTVPPPGAYMGYHPYHPGPNMMMHPGTMMWHPHHPSQGPLMAPGMIPAPIPGSGSAAAGSTAAATGSAGVNVSNNGSNTSRPATSSPAGVAAETGADIGMGAMDGMIPLIGYDGIPYGYMPSEEYYQQSMYVFGYMPPEGVPSESDGSSPGGEQGDVSAVNPYGQYPHYPGYPQHAYYHPQYPPPYYAPYLPGQHYQHPQGPPVAQQQPSGPGSRPSRSDSSSTRSSTSTLIPPTSSNNQASTGATGTTAPKQDKTKEEGVEGDVVVVVKGDVEEEKSSTETDIVEVDLEVIAGAEDEGEQEDERESNPNQGQESETKTMMTASLAGSEACERSLSEPGSTASTTSEVRSRSRSKSKSVIR
ncbi:hypothetical protein BGZ83_000891 [Gryganskiella cystojenkinii]|nr:hypothetical protein BGZ83_000891 [Gryganskiella cystojenkinii]